MRFARLLSLLAAIFTAATLLAPSAAAEPPFRLPDYVTDNSGVLNDRQLADVQKAVDQLYSERRVRLWVVFVDSFAPQGAVGWAQQTQKISDLGSEDAILAVATKDRSYSFLVSPTASGGSSTKVDNIRRDRIEPALRNSDWTGAAVAAANGLGGLKGAPAAGRGGGGGGSMLVPLAVLAGVGLLGFGGMTLWSRKRRRKAHEAAVTAAQNIDPTNPEALASVPINALDDLSKSIVVEVDNAVRTSANELVLAVEEFGETQTAPFATAVDNARQTLKQAFTVRQKLDDEVPEPLPERRDLLTRVVVSAAKANKELDTQSAAFRQMRDLVFNAPERLDALTQQLVTVTARLEPSDQKLGQLRTEFDEGALASVARNVTAARERVDFADDAITRGRELAAKPVAGEVGDLIDCVRGAESSLQQANTMLDAVDSAASDIRRAVSTLPAAIEDIQRGISQAGEQLAKGGLATSTELSTARDAAVRAVSAAQTTGGLRPTGALLRAGAGHRRVTGAVGVGLHRHPPRQHRLGGPHPTQRSRPSTRGRRIQAGNRHRRGDQARQRRVDAGRSGPAVGQRRRAGRPTPVPGQLWRAPPVRHGRDGRRHHPGQHPQRRLRRRRRRRRLRRRRLWRRRREHVLRRFVGRRRLGRRRRTVLSAPLPRRASRWGNARRRASPWRNARRD
jgi:phage shock protein A